MTLIDTDGQGVDRITEKGIVVGGTEYEVDCIIFATGFEVGTEFARRTGYEIIGRGGKTLSEKWADGMETLHGMQSHGFPNCFMMGVNQGGFAVNYPHILNECAVHISHIIGHALDKGFTTVEAGAEGEKAWVDTIVEKGMGGIGIGGPGCTPGYYNNEGHPHPTAAKGVPYGGGAIAFWQLLADWREAGTFEGVEFGD